MVAGLFALPALSKPENSGGVNKFTFCEVIDTSAKTRFEPAKSMALFPECTPAVHL
jgi:hypothetical protein